MEYIDEPVLFYLLELCNAILSRMRRALSSGVSSVVSSEMCCSCRSIPNS